MNRSEFRGRAPGPQEGEQAYASLYQELRQVRELKGLEVKKLVDASDPIARSLGEGLSSQLRHVLDDVIRIRMAGRRSGHAFGEEVRPRVILLKPRLAYQAGRERRMRALCDLLSAMIDRVHDQDDFEALAVFVESVVAYHRYHYGRDLDNRGEGRRSRG